MRRRLAVILVLPLVLLRGSETERPTPPHYAEWLEADGIRLRAIRAGTGDTTLVFLHGYGEHLLTWRSVIDPLARNYRILAIDLPGFGGSDKPDRSYTLDAMVTTVRAVLARWTDPPVIMVGHSMGGAIAAATTSLEPGRVVAVVLIAPAGIDIALGGVIDSMSQRRSTLIGLWEAARASVIPMHDPDWLGEPRKQARYDPALDPAFRTAAARILRDFQFEGMAARYYGLKVPTLLLWGAIDPVVPVAVADTLAKFLPCYQLAVLSRTLHRPQVERPDTVVTILKHFLSQPGCSPLSTFQ
ncbi:MAG TPA: alpha/beta fold hydrolase [Gemmatimonadales bacterium]